jgi:hypothetical protein
MGSKVEEVGGGEWRHEFMESFTMERGSPISSMYILLKYSAEQTNGTQ